MLNDGKPTKSASVFSSRRGSDGGIMAAASAAGKMFQVDNLKNIAGNVSNMAGNVSNMAGNVTNMAGNVTNMAGNVTNMAGNVTNMAGNVTNMTVGLTHSIVDGTNNLLGSVPGKNVLHKMADVVQHNAVSESLRQRGIKGKEKIVDRTNAAMGQMRGYMATQTAGALMARLGGDSSKEERPPFEYALLLKFPEKTTSLTELAMHGAGAIGKTLQSVHRNSVSAMQGRSKEVHPTANDDGSVDPEMGDKPPLDVSTGSVADRDRGDNDGDSPTNTSPRANRSRSSSEISIDPEDPFYNPLYPTLPPQHVAIIESLHNQGLQIMVVQDVYHHQKRKTLLLLNSPKALIRESVYRAKLLRWIRTGGIGDMPDKSKELVPTPSARILAIQNTLNDTSYCYSPDESKPGKPKLLLRDPLVEEHFPLHDHRANDYLLSRLTPDGTIAEKVRSIFMSDEVLDAIRNHFGDRTGFYYAYFSFYTRWLCMLAPGGVITLVVGGAMPEHNTVVLVCYATYVIFWGRLFVASWKQRTVELKTRWHLDDIEGHEVRRKEFKPDRDIITGKLVEDMDYYPDWKRYIVIPTMVPLFIALFCCLYACVLGLFWFEMWLVFNWGQCSEVNDMSLQRGEDPTCRSSAIEKGLAGTLAEIVPGVLEGLFFEILLVIFTLIAEKVCNLQNWRTQEDYNTAFAKQIFAMEFFGVFCWYFILSFLFVPVLFGNKEENDMYPYDKHQTWSNSSKPHWAMRCENDFDTDVLGFGMKSFSCTKEQCPYSLRVFMMKAYMLTPFVVNQLLNIVIKTGLPRWVHTYLKEEPDGDIGRCGRFTLGFCKVVGLILGHGGMRFRSEKRDPESVRLYKPIFSNENIKGIEKGDPKIVIKKKEMGVIDLEEETVEGGKGKGERNENHREAAEGSTPRRPSLHRIDTTRLSMKGLNDQNVTPEDEKFFRDGGLVKIESVMEQCLLWDFNEFNEQLELTLQFSWIMMFSSIFPLGSLIAMGNNIAEMRSDTYKLTKVCQRPIPALANGIGAWENILGGIVQAAVVVNVSIITISLNAFNLWEPDTKSNDYAGVFDNSTSIALTIFVTITVANFLLDIVSSLVPATPKSVQKMLKKRQNDLLKLFGGNTEEIKSEEDKKED